MEKHFDKKIEELSDRLMKESSLEKLSFNFTDAVMKEVNQVSVSKITEYKPLISKQIWVLIASALLVVLYIIVDNSNPSETNLFDVINFNALFEHPFITSFSSITVSKTVMYTIVLFGLMLCVQIPILKNYFDRRLEV